MNHRDFCYWLKGMLEGLSDDETINIGYIRSKLDRCLDNHVTDKPGISDEAKKQISDIVEAARKRQLDKFMSY